MVLKEGLGVCGCGGGCGERGGSGGDRLGVWSAWLSGWSGGVVGGRSEWGLWLCGVQGVRRGGVRVAEVQQGREQGSAGGALRCAGGLRAAVQS